MMKTVPMLSVFTPTFNRADLLLRGYQSLCRQTSHDFCWLIIDDGSTDYTRSLVLSWLFVDSLRFLGDNGFEGYSKDEPWLYIRYEYKDNGGLHTGYNKAIELMNTDICICIDSDDYMPDDGVEFICSFWKLHSDENLAGFIGLDFLAGKEIAVGGFFPTDYLGIPIHLIEVKTKLKHYSDTKMILRVDLLKKVAPQPSFKEEKNFNPIYMIMLVDRDYQFISVNKNLCYVDYQDSGMTANIYRQYVNSPNSFAALRLVAMQQPCITKRRYLIENLHYVADKFLARQSATLFNEEVSKSLLIFLLLPGFLLSLYFRFRAR